MKNTKLKPTQGFTLIELIIAIAIIAVLSAALIAGIDPIERFNQASDTSKRDSLLDIHKGLVSYYVNSGTYPTGLTTAPTGAGNAVATRPYTDALQTFITDMQTSNDIAKNFSTAISRATLQAISVYKVTDGSGGYTLMTCYQPLSKKFVNAAGLFNQSATAAPVAGAAITTALAPTAGTCALAAPAGRPAGTVCLYCAQ